MAGLGKKRVMTVSDRNAIVFLDSLSKAALADLVVDLIRQREGEDLLDGPALETALRAAFEPIAIARGDKMPKPATGGK
jgi:hypothetical protein